MLSIASINVNGLRSAAKKGLFVWLTQRQLDVICIQELKAQDHQLEEPDFQLAGYHRYLFPAERPGYSGTAIYSKVKPKSVKTGLGFAQADTEGRYIEADFGTVKVASLYLPSGSSGPERQACKDEFLELYLPILKKKAKEATPHIIVGDYNIAHKEIDLKNWKANQKNSGFLPHERAWLDELFDKVGFVDAFREVDPRPDQYTWWSNRGQAYAKNVGWRIDYQLVSAPLKGKAKRVEIYKDEKFSDHAPLIVDYDLTL